GNAHAGLHGFLNQPHLLGHRPATPALHGGNDFDPPKRLIGTLGHSSTHRRMPMPYRLSRLSGQNGVRSMKTRKGASEVLLTDVGFGISQVLPVITLLQYVPNGSSVILEQPEIHLHPLAQAAL